MASPERAAFGRLIDSIPARRWMPLLRAGACTIVAVWFLVYWLGGGLELRGSVRFWVPLCIPMIALVAAAAMAMGSRKRLDVYEGGLVYHTVLFELVAPWETITEIHFAVEQPILSSGYGGGLRNGPTPVMHVSFREERPWCFRANTYPSVIEKGEKLVEKLAAT